MVVTKNQGKIISVRGQAEVDLVVKDRMGRY